MASLSPQHRYVASDLFKADLSHNYDDLLNLPYGVATAQRGWIEKSRVLNAQPVDTMLRFKNGV